MMDSRSSIFAILFWVYSATTVATAGDLDGTDFYTAKLHKHYVTHPEKGMLLVARRGMPDPRFKKSVILLAVYDDAGALGLIVNRRSTAKLENLVPDVGALDKQGHHIYFGGPVGLERLKLLVRSEFEPQDAIHIMGDLFISGSHETLEQMLKLDKTQEEFRIYLGYAGWGPQQLGSEIERHDWYLHEASIEDIFDKHLDFMWQELIDLLDPKGELVEGQPRSDDMQIIVELAG
jgi:putative transcriptional regulator